MKVIHRYSMVLLICAIPFLALACISTMSIEQKNYLTKLATTPIYCSTAKECEIKWSKAIQWIVKFSYWKIRIQTDNLITTEGPLDTTEVAYRVQKIPLGNSQYKITMDLGCGNIFGCVPDTLTLKASFVKYVNAIE